MNIKHYHIFLNPWLQISNVSTSSERKEFLISDVCLSQLNIDPLKELGVDSMVFLLVMENTSHKTNVEDMVTFDIAKTEFQKSKQSLMKDRFVIGNTNSLNREDFPCLMNQYL